MRTFNTHALPTAMFNLQTMKVAETHVVEDCCDIAEQMANEAETKTERNYWLAIMNKAFDILEDRTLYVVLENYWVLR